ncbi:MAG: GNAT family N-acetyltransferase [Roseobacter sp.]
MNVNIVRATVGEPDVALLLGKHLDLMRAQSPAESCHALPASGLTGEDIHLFGARDASGLLAIGAIRSFGDWGEVKSMHTAEAARGRGMGRLVLGALIENARARGLSRLNLETGSGPEHAAARQLYSSEGFSECPPFGEYVHDPLSCFMTRAI